MSVKPAGQCSPTSHAFVTKRETIQSQGVSIQDKDVSELFCTRCGQVMLLSGRREQSIDQVIENRIVRPS